VIKDLKVDLDPELISDLLNKEWTDEIFNNVEHLVTFCMCLPVLFDLMEDRELALSLFKFATLFEIAFEYSIWFNRIFRHYTLENGKVVEPW